MNKQRRHFAGTEKVAILKRHLLEKVPVSQLCDEFNIAPTQFTNAEDILAAADAGDIAIGEVVKRFECPLIRQKN